MEQPAEPVPAKRPMEILIVGGSLAGLMAGILLKRKGHNVRILEQADSSERQGLAAGIGLSFRVKAFFENHDRLKETPLGVLNDGFAIIDNDLNMRYKLPVSTNLTSWDAAYYRLRANFDEYASPYCPQPPPTAESEGAGTYSTGKKVVKVENSDSTVRLIVEDINTGVAEEYQGDIVIAADGANSPIRRQLLPTLKREEPGYVIWRGTIPTKDLAQEVLANIEGKPLVRIVWNIFGSWLTFLRQQIWPGPQTYCVIYTIPGEYGSLAAGERHINFAWYFWPQFASLEDIMTDTDGHLHRSTIPKGKMRPEIWQLQINLAMKLLPKELSALVERIQKPFVSVISSIAAPKAAYLDNRLFLVGDALTQTQPNLGMGTNLAALAVTSLVNEVISPPDGLSTTTVERWQHKLLQETEMVRLRSVAFASWYLNSWPWIGYYHARYYVKLYWQYWFGKREENL